MQYQVVILHLLFFFFLMGFFFCGFCFVFVFPSWSLLRGDCSPQGKEFRWYWKVSLLLLLNPSGSPEEQIWFVSCSETWHEVKFSVQRVLKCFKEHSGFNIISLNLQSMNTYQTSRAEGVQWVVTDISVKGSIEMCRIKLHLHLRFSILEQQDRCHGWVHPGMTFTKGCAPPWILSMWEQPQIGQSL